MTNDPQQVVEVARATLAPVMAGHWRERSPATARRHADTLAARLDHTLLQPHATAEQIRTLCAEAREHGFASVCVNTRWAPLAVEELAGSTQMVCVVVGFPLGAMAPQAKAEEARIAVQ
jgi:deoxyribose-phosphate aldolase